jgi:MFS transporter, DHA1 family, inner membrane transport protein
VIRGRPTSAALMMGGVMGTLLVGNLLSGLSPVYIGALMDDLHLSEADAGLVMSVELIATAVALWLFSRRLRAIAPFRLATIGTIVVLAAQLASAFVTRLPPLLLIRSVSGCGASFALVAASILISRRPDPDRYIAIALVGTALVFTGIMGICGIAVAHYGGLGLYMVVAGTSVALLPLFVTIRVDPHVPSTAGGGQAPAPPALRSPRRAAIFAFVIAIAGLTFIGQAAWSFAQRSGTNAGIAAAEIGGWLAGSNLLTVLGSAFAVWVSTRITSIVPLVLGLLATGLTCAMQVGAQSSWAFQVPVLVNGLAFGFSMPFVFGTGARLDPSGTVVVQLNSAMLFTQAVTPLFAGGLIAHGSYQSLGIILGFGTLLATALVVPACLAARP